MKVIRSAASDDIDDRAACASKLRGVVRLQNRYFVVTVAQNRNIELTRNRVVVVIETVDQLIVRAPAQTIDRKVDALSEAARERPRIDHARQSEHQVCRIQCRDWQVRDLMAS